MTKVENLLLGLKKGQSIPKRQRNESKYLQGFLQTGASSEMLMQTGRLDPKMEANSKDPTRCIDEFKHLQTSDLQRQA